MTQTSVETAVLRFEEVTVRLSDERFSSLHDCSFTLAAGQLLSIRLASHRMSPIPALAIGDRPDEIEDLSGMSGRIAFEGIDWSARFPADVLAQRNRISLVLAEPRWVNNLNVRENVLLSQLHHTRRRRREIIAEAQQLAYRFGLGEVPPRRMSSLMRSELRRCEWVRALLGDKRLLVLERPCRDVQPQYWEALVEQLNQLRLRGGAVVWLCGDDAEQQLVDASATQRLAIRGERLVATGEVPR